MTLVRKRRTRGHVIADLSVNHAERHALLCGFSTERVQHDYGADLIIYTYDVMGEVENGQIYIQLKATDALNVLRDQQMIAFPVRRSDLELCLREPMPYILVLYDAQSDIAYWLYVQAYFERRHGFSLDQMGHTVTVRIPKFNVLDEAVVKQFARLKNDVLRQTGGAFIMRSKEITYGEFDRLLVGLGFVRGHTTGSHKVYEHKPSDTLILLPPTQPDEIVDALHRATVRRSIVERGAAEEDVYDKALEDLEFGVLATS